MSQLDGHNTPWNYNARLSFALRSIEGRETDLHGNLSEIVKDLSPRETVPETHRYTPDTYQAWDKAFKNAEAAAGKQAEGFAEYAALYEQDARQPAYQDNENVKDADRQLRKAISNLVGNVEQFRIENGKVVNVAIEKTRTDLIAERSEAETEKKNLQNELNELGAKPVGWFSGGKQEAWEIEHERLTNGVSAKEKRISEIGDWLRDTSADWSRRLAIPADTLKNLEGRTLTGAEMTSELHNQLTTLEPKVHEVQQDELTRGDRELKLREMEKRGFYKDLQNTFYGLPLIK